MTCASSNALRYVGDIDCEEQSMEVTHLCKYCQDVQHAIDEEKSERSHFMALFK